MKAGVLLFFGLGVLWLLLSQQGEVLLLGFGVLSCGLVVYLMVRLEGVGGGRNGGGRRLRGLRPWRLVGYWGWLAGEIVKSNIAVTRAILLPSMPIDPAMVRVEAGDMDDMRQVIYANSITLTPGTISADIDDEYITVHALFRDAGAELLEGEMMSRVAKLGGDGGGG